mgnify:CR=1 FL=1
MYCVLYVTGFINYLKYNFGYHSSNWKMVIIDSIMDIVVRRDVLISGNSIYIIYENYRGGDSNSGRGEFYIGRCISGDSNWKGFLKNAKYLEIIPVTLFFTEVL